MRGLTLISMIGYHAMWDLIYLFGAQSGASVHASWYEGTPGYLWQQSICWSFILISGYCLPYSRNPVKRGVIVTACGLVITVVTFLFMPEVRVQFGVLSFLGASMVVVGCCDRYMAAGEKNQIPRYARNDMYSIAISAVLFFLTRNVNLHRWGFEGLSFGRVPEAWYRNQLTAFLGFPPHTFFSTDYFSFIPWIFLFLTGYFLHYVIGNRRESNDRVFRSGFSNRSDEPGKASVSSPQKKIAQNRDCLLHGLDTLPVQNDNSENQKSLNIFEKEKIYKDNTIVNSKSYQRNVSTKVRESAEVNSPARQTDREYERFFSAELRPGDDLQQPDTIYGAQRSAQKNPSEYPGLADAQAETTRYSSTQSIMVRILEFLGKHSLVIYMLHQAVLYAMFYVIFVIF